MHNFKNINESNTLTIHLSRLKELALTANSLSKPTSIMISRIVSQVTALRWCLSNNLVNCLTGFDNATPIGAAIANDPNVPSLLYIRSAKLFAFYLLIIHRDYSTHLSNYFFNKTTRPSHCLSIICSQPLCKRK